IACLHSAWILRRQRARPVQSVELSLLQTKTERGKIFVVLLSGARTIDDGAHVRLLIHPGERYFRNTSPTLFGDVLNRFESPVVTFVRESSPQVELGQAAVLRRLLARAIFAGQKPAAKRTPGNHTDLFGAAERQDLALDFTRNQAVLRLQAVETRVVVFVADPKAFHQLPGHEVGGAEIADFALADQVVQGVHCLFDWRFEIPGMDL